MTNREDDLEEKNERKDMYKDKTMHLSDIQ